MLFLLLRASWRVAEPNEALIFSGLGARGLRETADSMTFKIVTGKGVLVLPGFQTARRPSLDTRVADLQAQVRKPGDAERDAQIACAEAQAREIELRAAADATRVKAAAVAEAEATRATGEAEAIAAKARGLAEAEAISARSSALAENPDAVVAQQLAEKWPEIVEAASKAFGNVDHMVVFNGADGVSDLLTKALSLGGPGLGLARQLMDAMHAPTDPAENSANGLPAKFTA
ncbi:flotillin domain-containing protein [Lentzea kentuckyensis]|uniref:flotillin domain-containing protein n=1 Tax=Lentzea kentuckyensis TaxID=360086 RepID=UPI001FE69596|nr:flotillin domain-containing protein [Lentzea kentuckyensis]